MLIVFTITTPQEATNHRGSGVQDPEVIHQALQDPQRQKANPLQDIQVI